MNGSTTGYVLPFSLTTPSLQGSDVTCYGYGSDGTLRAGSLLVSLDDAQSTAFSLTTGPTGASLQAGDEGGPCFAAGLGGPLLGVIADTVGVNRASAVRQQLAFRSTAFGWTPTTPPGIDPAGASSPDSAFDYCAGAATMCKLGRSPEYAVYSALCAAYRGTPPPCSGGASVASLCDEAWFYCGWGDVAKWQLYAGACTDGGGTAPACALPATPPLLPLQSYNEVTLPANSTLSLPFGSPFRLANGTMPAG